MRTSPRRKCEPSVPHHPTGTTPRTRPRALAGPLPADGGGRRDARLRFPSRTTPLAAPERSAEPRRSRSGVGTLRWPPCDDRTPRGRPCSVMRAPDGVNGERFFQRHAMPGTSICSASSRSRATASPTFRSTASRADRGRAERGHRVPPWNSDPRQPAQPGRLVFDLDPGLDVAFRAVIAAAEADPRARRGARSGRLVQNHWRRGPARRGPARRNARRRGGWPAGK